MTTRDDRGSVEVPRGQILMTLGSLLGVLAASSCCILPMVLFSLGVSGAWIGNLTQIAPYQPYILATALAFIGGGYWLVYRSSRAGCSDRTCARKLPSRFVKTGLVLATVLAAVALGFDFLAPLLLNR